MFNEHVDDFAKTEPLLAEILRSKDPKEREEGMRILDFMIEELESPDWLYLSILCFYNLN